LNNNNIQGNEFNTLDQKLNSKNQKILSNEINLENSHLKFGNKNKTIVQNTLTTNRIY
jgi:hypothetical protein